MEGQRRYHKLPELQTYPVDTNDFTKAILKLEKEVKIKQNIRTERFKFRKCSQLQEQTITEYIATLRDLACTCEFIDPDDAILDQFIEKMHTNKIREHLLVEEDLNLTKAIGISTRMESAINDAKTMHGDTNTSESNVNFGHKNKTTYSKGKRFTKFEYPKLTSTVPRPTDKKLVCYRCGSSQHKANYRTCPALKMKCKKCSRIGHVEKVCFNTNTGNELGENEEEFPHILSINTIKPTDSGSLFTILNESVYSENFTHLQLTPSDINPAGFGGNPITVNGYFIANIQYKGRTTSEKIYVTERGTSVIGWPTQSKLGIILDSNLQQPVLQTSTRDSILDEFPGVISDEASITAKYFSHEIKWKENEEPKQFQVRNVPFSVRPALKAELDSLQKSGVIEPISSSRWVSPIVIARKANGNIRMCVDLRDVNSKIVVERHPMPNIHEMLASLQLNGSTIYSTLDLSSAYHQIPLTEKSKDITAFITPEGLFRYTRVPFGLASASSLFQRMMGRLFKGMDGILYFQDDILLHAKSKDEHDKLLRSVLSKLRHHGLTIKREKCKIGVSSVEYLGHTLSSIGIQPKESLITAVTNAPTPADKDQLRSFLGL
ncbi:hypothetical protein SNE40_014954 [Patella caerulea]|uniref:Reverse transcriptase domain-containing protein n=1 Tax=Patella caerulea TaxID=87958 RepID=A0AAN8JFY4_PATCE